MLSCPRPLKTSERFERNCSSSMPSRQFALRFHIAVVDASLRAALEGHDNQIFHEGLTLSVADLAAAIRNPGRGCGLARCLFCQAAWKARA